MAALEVESPKTKVQVEVARLVEKTSFRPKFFHNNRKGICFRLGNVGYTYVQNGKLAESWGLPYCSRNILTDSCEVPPRYSPFKVVYYISYRILNHFLGQLLWEFFGFNFPFSGCQTCQGPAVCFLTKLSWLHLGSQETTKALALSSPLQQLLVSWRVFAQSGANGKIPQEK